jgi:hypothetical protein
MNINRLEVSQTFDDVVSEVDRRFEEFVRDNIHNQTLIDEVIGFRETWIKDIRECEAYCLSFLNEQVEPLPNEVRFKKFCFVIELFTDHLEDNQFHWRLVCTDMYLRPGQIRSFQELLKFMDVSVYSERCDPRRSSRVVNQIFTGISTAGFVNEVSS